MKLKWICCCVCIVMAISSAGQDNKPRFSSINTGGIITGKSKSYGMFQSVNGLLYKKWFAGMGAGYDYYYYGSAPVFIDARRYLGKENDAFLYGDIGYNFPGKNKPGEEVFYYTSYNFKGGLYSDIGVGYGFKLVKKISLLFSGGFTYKNIRLRTAATSLCLVPPCPENINNYNYDLSRILFKAGIQF